MSELPLITALPSLPGTSGDLPQVGGEVRERCDAARNRRRILAAAQTLVARDGASCVSMDQIAAEAGVGKGTLFRRFGDRAGLLRALLSDREAAFMETLIRGEAPLGPGAPAAERLLAFGPAYLRELQDYAELLAAAEIGHGATARLRSAPYQVYRTHLSLLLRECAPGLDPGYAADVLLAPLAADVMLHQRDGLGYAVEALAAQWTALARRLLQD